MRLSGGPRSLGYCPGPGAAPRLLRALCLLPRPKARGGGAAAAALAADIAAADVQFQQAYALLLGLVRARTLVVARLRVEGVRALHRRHRGYGPRGRGRRGGGQRGGGRALVHVRASPRALAHGDSRGCVPVLSALLEHRAPVGDGGPCRNSPNHSAVVGTAAALSPTGGAGGLCTGSEAPRCGLSRLGLLDGPGDRD